ncbi:hypothetical protein [Actinomadura litoris]|uniref:hypothetical protein n=1 Tax=Actinomadura litoris TaxID=2678616 RepID=UPI001FA6EB8D|nr:hypothetical protein [Actinomadura litoris]
MKWIAPGGVDVELISLDHTPTLRCRRLGILLAYCTSVRELERVLARRDLTTADLVQILHPAGNGPLRRPPARP